MVQVGDRVSFFINGPTEMKFGQVMKMTRRNADHWIVCNIIDEDGIEHEVVDFENVAPVDWIVQKIENSVDFILED